VVEARVGEGKRPAVGDLEAEVPLARGQPPPRLDLRRQLVHRRDVHAPAGERDGEQLGTGEIEHALSGTGAELAQRPGKLEVAARVERDDDAHDRLAQVAAPHEVA